MTKITCPLPPVDQRTYNRFSHYAKVVGKPLEQVISKALNRWMDDFGEPVLDSYQEMARKMNPRGKQKAAVLAMSTPTPDQELRPFILPKAAAAGK